MRIRNTWFELVMALCLAFAGLWVAVSARPGLAGQGGVVSPRHGSPVLEARAHEASALAGRLAAPVDARRTALNGSVSDLAYQELIARATENESNFFVYQDEDAGGNHGYPSGQFGDLSVISIDAGCVDDPADTTTGCFPSTDTAALDMTRGTVLRVSFAPLPQGQFAGLNIEEPENWGVLQTGLGYDLTGASNVVFDVRSPQGAAFQFGVGGCVTSYITIPQTWTTMTISLNGLVPGGTPCPPILQSVHILFSVATNDVHDTGGATVLIDNIRFTPVPARVSQGSETLSLPLSTQTFGVVPQLSSFPPDQVNRNVASTYEAALTVLALLHRGQPADLASAQAIANALDYALKHDNHGDPIPVAPDGSVGLHNAYESGDIAFLNGQQAPKLGQAGDARLAGFTVPTTPPTFDLVLDGATGGNNAFAILALGAAYLQFNDATYLDDARTIGTWIVGNLTDSTGTGYGGYYLGYPDQGVPPPKPLIQGKSTENNADIFAAFSLLGAIDSANAASWNTRAKVAGDFVASMFASSGGRFNAGTITVADAMNPGPGVCPDLSSTKGNDVINTCDFLDSNSFTTLAMAGSQPYGSQIDWTKPTTDILSTFPQTIMAGGLSYSGLDIVQVPISGANGVAWEFTGQTVETCTYLDVLLGVTTFQPCAQMYAGQIAQAQSSAPFGDGLGVVASTLQGENAPPSNLPPVAECLNTPFQCVPERVGLAATAWAILQDQKINPFYFYPTVTLAPVNLTFTTEVVGTTSAQQTVKMTNIGSITVTDVNVTVSGTNAGDFPQNNTCGSDLAPMTSCVIDVAFKPAGRGARTAMLSIADSAPGSPQVVSLTGIGTVVRLSPEKLSFGNVPVGQTSPAKTVMLTNVGNTKLAFSGLRIGGKDAGDFSETNNCGVSLRAHATCTISTTFTPKAKSSRKAYISIQDNGGGSPQQVPLSGIGT